MSKWRPKKKIAKFKHLLVFECRDKDNKIYYTTVNTRIGVHRHYKKQLQAIMTAKRAAQTYLPPWYCDKAKKDIMYLITGQESVYEKTYSKRR